MKKNNSAKKKSVLSNNPAWGSAAITAVSSVFLIFLLAFFVYIITKVFGISTESTEEMSDFIAYLGTGLVVALMCYLISKAHPKSFWYAPIICNTATIAAVLANMNDSHLIPFGIGWIFSIIGTISGVYIGKRGITLDKK